MHEQGAGVGQIEQSFIDLIRLKNGPTVTFFALMTHTGDAISRSSQQLLSTVAYRIDGKPSYALEGSIFVAGVAIQWLRDQLGLIEHAAETADAFARTKGETNGVYVVPAFTGLGAPYWQPQARGLISGLTLDSDKDQIGYQAQK